MEYLEFYKILAKSLVYHERIVVAAYRVHCSRYVVTDVRNLLKPLNVALLVSTIEASSCFSHFVIIPYACSHRQQLFGSLAFWYALPD